MAELDGTTSHNRAEEDGPFSRYNNSHWKRVSMRNSQKAGYAVSAELQSDQLDDDRKIIKHTVRRNQSNKRRNSRGERPKKRLTREGQQSIDSDGNNTLDHDPEGAETLTGSRSTDPHPSISSMTSNSSVNSTAEILPNPHNKLNRSIYALLTYPCCMLFFVVCCYPGVRLMRKSDKYHQDNNDESAKTTAKLATFSLCFGLFLTLCIVGVLLFVIIYFTTR